MRNPLYAWTHLELKRVFGISKILNPSTAAEIYSIAPPFCNNQAIPPGA